MKKSANQYFKLGILIMAGLAFFIASIYLLGKKQNLFDSVVLIKSKFNDVKGLKLGNNVRFSGINIGTVTNIRIVNDSTVMVEMSIKKEVTQFIRKDSKVELENEGLMGNKILTIYPGSANLPAVEKGDVLIATKSLATEDLLEQGKDILVDGKTITEQLAEISTKLNTGNGDFATLLNENRISEQMEETSKQLVILTSQLNEIIQKINYGDGDIAKLINDDDVSVKLNNIMGELDSITETTQTISDNLMHTTNQINNGNGIIHKLIYDTVISQQLDSSLIKVNTGLDEAKRAAETIHNSWVLNLFSKDK